MIRRVIPQLYAVLVLFLVPPRLPADIHVEEGLTYAIHGGEELKLDLALPDGDDGHLPLIVLIHGGGWQRGSRFDLREGIQDLARRGYAAASVSYRFTPKHRWPAQLEDVEAAVRWLRANAKKHRIDTRRVGAAGYSAGGHLSILLGVIPRGGENGDAGVDVVGNYFGPTDISAKVFSDYVDRLIADLAGGTREERGSVYRDISPATRVTRASAPVLTFHGSSDPVVPVEQARVLHRALDAAHVPNRLDILEGLGHGWDGAELTRTRGILFEFFDAYLKGAPWPLVLAEDFLAGAERWEPTDKSAWKVERRGGEAFYSLVKRKSDYQPAVRSPHNISLLRGVEVEDFVLDVELKSTVEDYGHRDLCLFFGHQDSTHFYYAHLGKKADPHAHSIFLVNGTDRVSIAQDRTGGVDWDDGWHRARVRRDTKSGSIEVYLDDMTKPIMSAVDKTFLKGRVGLGSFDDTGTFTEVRLRARASQTVPARL